MQTFSIQTLGCKVNQYESDQIATLLRRRGLRQVEACVPADLRVVNTCSVTVQAASKSRQAVRRTTRLPVLDDRLPRLAPAAAGSRTLVTGCWATSDPQQASALKGVDAVITHHHDVSAELERLLDRWLADAPGGGGDPQNTTHLAASSGSPTESVGDDGWTIGRAPQAQSSGRRDAGAGTPAEPLAASHHRLPTVNSVKQKPASSGLQNAPPGTRALPLLADHRDGHQRAFLKVQDGCDAHCTYCIIPHLRPSLWSKPIPSAIDEARRLVDAGHTEIVLTGIFLGAYGQTTALRRRQQSSAEPPLGQLVEALCTRVPGMRRLRLSSLEPGDLTPKLIHVLRAHAQVVPHFHLPLQSGSDAILRRMNRQYSRDDFLRMIDRVRAAFDRPAITTDIIVGFPGETDSAFAATLDVVDRARFIHTHAFSYSPRPGTAAARWQRDYIRGPVVNQRIELLTRRAAEHSLDFRRQFIGQTVEVLVERVHDPRSPQRHGRCERYFDVLFEGASTTAGDCVSVMIESVDELRTWGQTAGGAP